MNTHSIEHSGILGMKWGVRRYQNKDGTLTEEGKKRYAKELAKNEYRSSKTKYSEKQVADVNRWVTNDIKVTKESLVVGSSAINKLDSAVSKPNKQKRLDLSDKTDEELRAKINREQLERQYNQYFNSPEMSNGQRITHEALQTAGIIVAGSVAVLDLALKVKELTA